MKYLIVTILGLSLFLLSFQKQINVGKIIFDNNCKSCHLPNKATTVAPSFQNIRKDYGLQWALAFVKNSQRQMDKKDVKTLYSYYLFGKHKHIRFPVLEAEYVIKVLDYVDSFPIDTSQFRHRLLSYSKKLKFVHEQMLKDSIKPTDRVLNTLNFVDTTSLEDTAQVQPIRRIYKRARPTNN